MQCFLWGSRVVIATKDLCFHFHCCLDGNKITTWSPSFNFANNSIEVQMWEMGVYPSKALAVKVGWNCHVNTEEQSDVIRWKWCWGFMTFSCFSHFEYLIYYPIGTMNFLSRRMWCLTIERFVDLEILTSQWNFTNLTIANTSADADIR